LTFSKKSLIKNKEYNKKFTPAMIYLISKSYRMMKSIRLRSLLYLFIAGLIIFSPLMTEAQHAAWYQNAQQRIDTLRKNDYGLKIYDKDGQPYTGKVSVRMDRHEFPFGVAFDFQQGEATMGSTYSTNTAVNAPADAEIYRTERWARYLAYVIPVESGKEYKITLKFAEIFHGANNLRVFDVLIDGEIFLKDFDVHAVAGGRNRAIDTSLTVNALSNLIRIELQASKDNVAIKGIIVEEKDSQNVLRINCGGQSLTTSQGNFYMAETGFFDPDAVTVASNDDWKKATMLKYFNAGVNENSFKWSGVQPNPGPPNYTNFDNAVRWTQKVGWDYRAHTLLWGGNDNHSMPNWVRNLPTPKAIVDTCKMRVIRDVTRYRGIIKEYDVINEPLTNHADWLRKTVGDSIIWDSFKWARSVDPDAELYINDYNVELNWGQSIEYRDLILKMLANGAPVTGVGVQAHFWDCCRPNVNEVVRNMNILAETGLPIKLTEYDYGGNLTQAQQAADYIMVLTIAFSHPSIVGMYHWSLRDGWSWRENSGFFDSSGKPKLAADTLLYYTKTKWATNFDTNINGTDPLVFNAYHGNYNIEVEFDGVVKVFNVPLLKANADSIFVLHEADAKLKGPELLKTELVNKKSIRLMFDKPINSNSLRRSNFKFLSPGNIGINAVSVDLENENNVIITLSSNVTRGNYIAVSYYPGSLLATDGGVAAPFGPVPVPNSETTVNINLVNSNSVKIYPNPAVNSVSISSDSAPFTIHVYNGNGILVHSETSDKELISIDVSHFGRGMYIVRLTDGNNLMNAQKLILK
jgi:GH35 family endo-1,4-beta-xylanase